MCFSIYTAKLKRELFRDYSKKKLNISKTALSLIFHLTPFVDLDGRIHFKEEVVRAKMVCDPRSFQKALNELCETTYNGKKLLTYANGYYVSNFHIATNGEQSYLKQLPIFTSPNFLNLSLNRTRLFLYVATLNVRNQDTSVAVENLYKNNLHDSRLGMPVYESYQDMVEDLFYLIDNGFISVRLHGESSSLDKNDVNYKNHFNEMCGFKNNKKRRTSKYFKSKHVIGLKINKELFKEDAIENEASKAEIRLLCDRYHMFHEDLYAETFNYIIGKKNDMIKQFGNAGLDIYRISLEKYFKEKHENIVYYNLLGKAANHFTDFYLLEEIKKVILAALKSTVGSRGDLASTGYLFSEAQIPSLVKYFVANSSDEHKVLIDQDIQLIEYAHKIVSRKGVESQSHWSDLGESIEAVYELHGRTVLKILKEECIKTGASTYDLFQTLDIKALATSYVMNALYASQEALDEEVKKLKQIVLFFRKKNTRVKFTFEQPEEKPFVKSSYDWITQE